MRLFLLPISTRRSMIFCERARESLTPGQKQPLTERVVNKANETWVAWERAEKGWQKWITHWGNQALKRIPYEEWGLKTLPSATTKRFKEVDEGKLQLHCLYPAGFMGTDRVLGVLSRLATERQSLHKSRLLACVLWMPVMLPFAAVPVLPNIPLYYLIFRAYSHYRALHGGRMLEHIVRSKHLTLTPSPKMDELYASGLLHPNGAAGKAAPVPTEEEIKQVAEARGGGEDAMLLQKWNGEVLAEAFSLPEMEIEIERAVEQVGQAMEKERLAAEKSEQDQAPGKDKPQ